MVYESLREFEWYINTLHLAPPAQQSKKASSTQYQNKELKKEVQQKKNKPTVDISENELNDQDMEIVARSLLHNNTVRNEKLALLNSYRLP